MTAGAMASTEPVCASYQWESIAPWRVRTKIDEVKDRHRLHRPYLLWVRTIEPRRTSSGSSRRSRRSITISISPSQGRRLEPGHGAAARPDKRDRRDSCAQAVGGGTGRAARFTWERTADELTNAYREVAA
jgi:hypothetical protein